MIRIYWIIKSQYLKTAMEYRFNFWMMAVGGFLMRALMMGVAFVLYRNVPGIAGFTEGQVYLIMSFMFITEGMSNIFFDGIWYIPRLVFGGELDVMLSRPVSPLYQILSHEVGLQGVGVLGIGFLSLFMALTALHALSFMAVLLSLMFIVCGTAVRTSGYLIGACNVFWLKAGGQVNVPYTLYSVGEFARYPVKVYPLFMQIVLFGLIPYAFIGYVPCLVLSGQRTPLYILLTIAVSAAYSLLARAVFYRGIRKYESMGM
jgi:ABC-2 type transport system permease protein